MRSAEGGRLSVIVICSEMVFMRVARTKRRTRKKVETAKPSSTRDKPEAVSNGRRRRDVPEAV